MELADFTERTIETGEARIFARIGGSGPPLVCLHGYPQTHLTWRNVAPALAEHHTVVLIDNRGYGASSFVEPDADHHAYSKRACARDVVAVMSALGFERFCVAGHDRGGRIAYRLALDHPERVSAIAVLDIMPTLDTWELMTADTAYSAYHWLFLAQPAPLPESLIAADPDLYFRHTIESWLHDRSAIDEPTMAAYVAAMRRPETIRAACEDYRAGNTCDRAFDLADRNAQRKIHAPLHVLFGRGPTARASIDFVEVWRRWATSVSGRQLPNGHFLMEEAPAAVISELTAFFRAHASTRSA